MNNVLIFLNNNSGALSVIFSAIVTISTVIYALLTAFLVSETRKMRHAQTEPRIDVTYRSREEWIPLLDIVVKNIGLGPAYDIKFEIEPIAGGEILEKELKDKKFLSSGLNYLSPGQEISSFFTNATEHFEEKMFSQLTVRALYKNYSGKKYAHEYLIDLSELKGITKIGEPPLHNIAKNIEQMQKDIGRLSSGFHRLKTDIYTSEDREKSEQERIALRAEAKNKQLKQKSS